MIPPEVQNHRSSHDDQQRTPSNDRLEQRGSDHAQGDDDNQANQQPSRYDDDGAYREGEGMHNQDRNSQNEGEGKRNYSRDGSRDGRGSYSNNKDTSDSKP